MSPLHVFVLNVQAKLEESWLAYKDSNLERLNQNQLCYQLHHRPRLNRGCKFRIFLELAKIKNGNFVFAPKRFLQ